MSGFFSKNQVVMSVTEPALLPGDSRILHVDNKSDLVVLITLEPILKRPWSMPATELSVWLRLGHVKLVESATPKYMMIDEDSIPANLKEYRDQRWEKIRPLLTGAHPEEVLYPSSMGSLVYAHASRIGVPAKSIYRILYKYWAFGMLRNALLPDRSKIGSPGKIKTYKPGVIPGRKPRHLGELIPQTAKLLTESDRNCIRAGYVLFVNKKIDTISGAYIEMLRRFYKKKQLDGSKEELLPTGQIPTERQFDTWGKRYFDDLTVLKGRAGSIVWNKDHRAIRGTVRERLHGPGHLFEVDATIADVYLVSRYNRHWVIGRPVVYVVIDSFSGMITGIHVGLEGPSWNGARQALFNAFTDKEKYCKAYGVDLEKDEWPCHHLPHEIFADRGEMIGQAAEGLVSGLKIDLGIAPPYRPDWKPIVESAFKVLNDTIQIEFIPGAVIARETERGARDYRQDAVLDIKEFTEIIIRGVLHYNKFNRQPARLTRDMIAADVEPTPISIWRWALENHIIESNVQSESLVYLHLLPREVGKVHKGGILFKGMFYVCDWAIEQGMFARARHRGVSDITCWFDPNYTEHIWVQGPDKAFVRCDLRLSEARYREFRIEEVEDMLAILNQEPPSKKREKLESKVALKSASVDIVNAAKREKKATPAPASKAEKVAGIKANRASEKASLREQSPVPEGIRSNSSHGVDAESSTAPTTERTAEIISLLSRLGPTAGGVK
ncbi:Mu transposase C-terminal domain-containing protein [Pseudomonas sp. FP1740]|uniref:Mu transposase C-terminal domain-containing protein n=1 Tax=Pseudomonas sp. FP1740 TaxID=2954078 RepID=UPI00273402BD|nr:Mu transposase C-terminal domain-containing protein [Pseudomonas sp. FP1740]WLG45027.1 Mu transposase C-terminal domain-containing protein [Pseudomonas sp. FP1740]